MAVNHHGCGYGARGPALDPCLTADRPISRQFVILPFSVAAFLVYACVHDALAAVNN